MTLDQSTLQAIANHPEFLSHPSQTDLLAVVGCETQISSAGFPYWCEWGFRRFIDRIPHLFQNGLDLLNWIDAVKAVSKTLSLKKQEAESLKRALKVMGTVVRTASVTAPSDLWLLRQVLGTHRELGLLERLLETGEIRPDEASIGAVTNMRQLKIDLHFLVSRGYLDSYGDAFLLSSDPAAQAVLKNSLAVEADLKTDLVSWWMAWFSGTPDTTLAAEKVMLPFPSGDHARPAKAWMATGRDIELGYRLVPVVLALRALNITKSLSNGQSWQEIVPHHVPYLSELMTQAGLVKEDRVTALGARVFQRGPGPFGIIGAYYPYMNQLPQLLKGEMNRSWVNRGKNVAASQDANRKTFAQANDALDRFCKAYDFQFKIFIEHAVGRGEATRQRFELSGDKEIRYFGADLEDAAIEQAELEQKAGHLPSNMRFIRGADIGDPQKVLDGLKTENLDSYGSVMMVGNGFHEIRDQTNQKMLQVLKDYQQAGIVLIFTEETGLADDDLLATAWNTYHAGFRYVHEMSGQGLRPSWDNEKRRKVWSWRKCARRAGYTVLDSFTTATRTIFPTKKPHRKNPSISVTYFCVPQALMEEYGITR